MLKKLAKKYIGVKNNMIIVTYLIDYPGYECVTYSKYYMKQEDDWNTKMVVPNE